MISKDKLEIIKREVIAHTLEYWGPNDWTSHTMCLVYDSQLYSNVREFSIVFDEQYNILYVGWQIGEAYWQPNKAPKEDVLQISNISDIEDDDIIFFDEYGRSLNRSKKFDKFDNVAGEIVARDLSGHWWNITPRGPEEPID